jgi:hypothetical protein
VQHNQVITELMVICLVVIRLTLKSGSDSPIRNQAIQKVLQKTKMDFEQQLTNLKV